MNFVFLSPHFPANYYHFCTGLRKAGATVLGIADAEYDSLQPELKAAFTEYYRVDDMNDYNQLVRALGFFTHRYGKIDRLDSLNEHWLETEAKLRTDFNIPGIKADAVADIKRKSVMKKMFRKARVTAARGELIPTLETAKEFAAQVGYPVVVKPNIGVGAANTYRLNSEAELETFFTNQQPVDFIMEEFVQGAICSFDGLVDHTGNLVFYTSHQYCQGIMETVTEDLHVAYYSVREVPADLEKAGRNILKAYDLRDRFFHIEFFRLEKTNKLVALEVNMRPPGGLTMDMFNYANNINLYDEWANVLVTNQFRAQYDRPYHVCYVGRKNNKSYVHSHEAILATYGDLIVQHEPISGIFSAALGDYGYLVRSPELAQIDAARTFIHQLS